MRNRFLIYAAILLTISPVILAFVWHINNHGWPSDDAANYMLTAYRQYRAFCDGSLVDGLQGMYQVRGWRPILFPVLATPFLWLFNGSVLAATAATLLLCFLVCQVYVFAIAMRYLDPIRASFVAAFVGSSQAIAAQSTIFYAEMAWLAFFTGFVFHLLESDKFHRLIQATIAGSFLGFAAIVRPAETLAIASIPLVGMIVMALAEKGFSISSAARVTGFVLLGACLLVASIFAKQVGYQLVIGAGVVITLAQLLLINAGKTEQPSLGGLNIFAISFMAINMLWWANSMPQLYSWIYDTSFGTMAQVTDVSVAKEGVFTVLKQIFSKYLFPQGFLVAAMCLLLLVPIRSRALCNTKQLSVLAMITLGLLVPMCALYAVTGTSDFRRVFVGMAFLLTLLSVLSLQDGSLRRVRDIGFAFIVALQLLGFLWSAKGGSLHLDNFASLRADIPMPKIKADQNEALISRLLELGVPKSSTVAVYTMALFQARDRIYEPAALQLASLTTRSNLNVIYYWDAGDYSAVIERLRRDSAKFLLIDKYRDPKSVSMHQQPVKFATALLDKLENSHSDPQGLRQVATFKLDGREQVLFEILYPRIMASSLNAQYSPEGLIGKDSISIVSSEQTGFPKQALNDNSAAAWGSREDDPIPFAAYTFSHPVCLNLALVQLMEEHMKDLRLIATLSPNDDPTTWPEIPARLDKSGVEFSEKVSVPSGPDSLTVVIQPKRYAVNHPVFGVGIICNRSKGDVCNHHPNVGSGMYLRELDFHATQASPGSTCPE